MCVPYVIIAWGGKHSADLERYIVVGATVKGFFGPDSVPNCQGFSCCSACMFLLIREGFVLTCTDARHCWDDLKHLVWCGFMGLLHFIVNCLVCNSAHFGQASGYCGTILRL